MSKVSPAVASITCASREAWAKGAGAPGAGEESSAADAFDEADQEQQSASSRLYHVHCVDDTHTLSVGAHSAGSIGTGDIPAVVVRAKLAGLGALPIVVSSSGIKRTRATDSAGEVADASAVENVAKATGLDPALLSAAQGILGGVNSAAGGQARLFSQFERLCGRVHGIPALSIIVATTESAYAAVVAHLASSSGTSIAANDSTKKSAPLHPDRCSSSSGPARERFVLAVNVVTQAPARVPALYAHLLRELFEGGNAEGATGGWEAQVDTTIAQFCRRRAVEVRYTAFLA